ncbi:MAG: (d)CMP kinase [Deltaproteobacteria bacterium]|nr:(d)CMP kinase [Deltaproteobacteria bacterium]
MSGRRHGLVIAIDGPSGAGKSTVAGQLAQRLGYRKIDTGAMYRAMAWLIDRAGIDPADVEELERLCSAAEIRLDCPNDVQRVFANGEDVTELIRTPAMSLMTSRISALKPVREAMLRAQRLMGQGGGVVLEGRDIGTVVFPDAEVKFYLFASPEERGRRRFAELAGKGEQVTQEETVAEVARRDLQDSERDLAPLRQADDAIAIDSSAIGIEEVLGIMEAAIREKISSTESVT